jgi:hypothetical protein
VECSSSIIIIGFSFNKDFEDEIHSNVRGTSEQHKDLTSKQYGIDRYAI